MRLASAIKIITVTALVVFNTACPKTKTSRSSASSQAASLQLSSTSYGLQPNAQATITATGGTGIYTGYTATQGALQPIGKGQYAYTAPVSATSNSAVITVTDSAGTQGSLTISLTGGQSTSQLAMYSTASPIPVGGNVTLSVVGGTGPYTWSITAGGGTLAQTTGQAVGYTAPAQAGSVTVLVQDSKGASLSATIPISGQSQTTCNGYYALNAYGSTGTLYLSPGNNGAITGSLNYNGSTFSLTGTCTANNITFTLNDGTVFTGGFYYTQFDPYIASMVGTFGAQGQTWVAVPQR